MTRGVPHSPELRAQVVAAVLAGMSIRDAAEQFGLDKGLVSRWVSGGLQLVATEKGPIQTDTELVMDYFRSSIRAMIVQAHVFADEQYCRAQPAAGLAIAHGVLGDKFVVVAAAAQALGLITGPTDVDGQDDEPDVATPRLPEPTE